MAAKKPQGMNEVDSLLKGMFVFARAVEQVLDTGAIAACGETISQTKMQIIHLLGRQGAQTSTRVALFLGVSKPAVTQTVDAMVKGRLVVRGKTPRDRREVELRLAPKGTKIFQAVSQYQRSLLRDVMRKVSARSAGDWAAALQGMTEALAHAPAKSGPFCLQCAGHAEGSCVLADGDEHCPFLQQGEQADRRAAKHEKK